MSYTYLQEEGEESSAESFADIPAYVLSRLNLTDENRYTNVNETASYQSSQFGTTCEPLMESPGAGESTCFALDFHAKTCQLQAQRTLDWMGNEADYGQKPSGLFAKLDQATSCWKTPQTSLFADYPESFNKWPQWGMMLSGECFQENMSVPLLKENEFLLPAPTKSMAKRGWGISNQKKRYSAILEENARIFGYKPHPSLLEWSMGWIPMWTRLQPLGTDKFQQWLRSHGKL